MANEEEKKSILEKFIPQLKDFVQSETVFGKPYEIGEVQIIPVNSVKVGFGFGDSGFKKSSEASGGGGGVLLSPVAFIIVKEGQVSFHSLSGGTIENVMEKIPDFVDKLTNIFSKKAGKKGTEKKNEDAQ